jgi:hypothetical protein
VRGHAATPQSIAMNCRRLKSHIGDLRSAQFATEALASPCGRPELL